MLQHIDEEDAIQVVLPVEPTELYAVPPGTTKGWLVRN
jgi:hypothetical protein